MARSASEVVQRRPDCIGDWATITEEGERDSGVYINNSKRPSNNSDSEPGSRASNNPIVRPGGVRMWWSDHQTKSDRQAKEKNIKLGDQPGELSEKRSALEALIEDGGL